MGTDGGIFAFGPQAGFDGSLAGASLTAPIVGGAQLGHGYVLTSADGNVYAMGCSVSGDLHAVYLNAPIVGIVSAGAGGFWMVGTDGGVFAFGSAHYDGSLGAQRLDAPIASMAADSRGGYWLVDDRGQVFPFGAPEFGGVENIPLTAPIVGIGTTPAPALEGYWLMGADGGVFTFGSACTRAGWRESP